MSDLSQQQILPCKHQLVAVEMLLLRQLVQQPLLAVLRTLTVLEQQLQSSKTLKSSFDYFPFIYEYGC
jgi:hypothetical protein